MRKLTFAALVAALSLCVASGCTQKPDAAPTDVPVDIAEVQSQVAGNSDFAVALYGQVRDKPGNVVFSPYSISAALAMTYDGARGETARQMADVLRFPADRKLLPPAFRDLNRKLAKHTDGFEMTLANALWGQKNFAFHAEFLDATREFYGAEMRQVDFIDGRDAALKTINDWVNRETRTKIPTILQPTDLSEDTRLVLTNAIYLKGQWAAAFDKQKTRDGDFHRTAKDTVRVPMMHRPESKFPYASVDGVEIVELPYRGNGAGMVVILPGPSNSPEELERTMTAGKLADWIGRLRPTEIDVSLPRFKVEKELRLNETLKKMGMTDAVAGADFSGMTSAARLFISAVIHKAVVEVDEEGTVAAAATAVVMRKDSKSGRVHFDANRPFLFLIRDRATESILFLGRVTDPTAAK